MGASLCDLLDRDDPGQVVVVLDCEAEEDGNGHANITDDPLPCFSESRCMELVVIHDSIEREPVCSYYGAFFVAYDDESGDALLSHRSMKSAELGESVRPQQFLAGIGEFAGRRAYHVGTSGVRDEEHILRGSEFLADLVSGGKAQPRIRTGPEAILRSRCCDELYPGAGDVHLAMAFPLLVQFGQSTE